MKIKWSVDVKDAFAQLQSRVAKGEVKVALLVTSGRNGANLLQSLIDMHSEVLMIPSIFWFYFDWDSQLAKHASRPRDLVETLIGSTSFSIDWYTTGLGQNKDEIFDMQRAEIKEVMLEVLGDQKQLSRKDCLIALHVAYACVKEVSLESIKVIVQHHHFPLTGFSRDYFILSQVTNLFRLTINPDYAQLYDEFQSDFSDGKTLHMIRNPYDGYNSFLQAITTDNGHFDIQAYFFSLYGLLSGYRHAIISSEMSPELYKIVKFEDLHLATESTMRDIASFLGISYLPSLVESTIGGKLWWGNNPAKPINGTSPSMVTDNWRSKLDGRSLGLCSCMFDSLATQLGYTPIGMAEKNPPCGWVANEKASWLDYFKSCFKSGSLGVRMSKLSFFFRYPMLRNRLIKYYRSGFVL